jgi:uncharacterized protein YjbK
MKKEIEVKYLLSSKSDMEWLSHFLEPYASSKKKYYFQENFYFDTPALSLRHKGISLRLRKQNDQILLCAKQSLAPKKSKKEHLSVRLEYEAFIEPHVAELMTQELVSPIEVFATLPANTEDEKLTQKTLYRRMKKTAKTGLQIIGSFVNNRTLMPVVILDENIDVEFDHAQYPKGVEIFEIEVEFESEQQAKTISPALESIFKKAQIKTKQSCSKSSRLYKLLYG